MRNNSPGLVEPAEQFKGGRFEFESGQLKRNAAISSQAKVLLPNIIHAEFVPST